MKTYGRLEVQLHPSYHWYWMEVSGQHHAPATVPLGNSPRIHCIGSWVGLGASLDVVHKKKISCTYWELNPESLVL
jgi:hypothetical protein